MHWTVLIFLALASSSGAQQGSQAELTNPFEMRPEIVARLQEATDCIDARVSVTCAIAILSEVRASNDLTRYEHAQVLLSLGNAHDMRQESAEAMLAYNEALARGPLPLDLERVIRSRIAQIFYREQRYEEALNAVSELPVQEQDYGISAFRAKVLRAMNGEPQIGDREELEVVVSELVDSIEASYECALQVFRRPVFEEFTGQSTILLYPLNTNNCVAALDEIERRGVGQRITFFMLKESKTRDQRRPPDDFVLIHEVVE